MIFINRKNNKTSNINFFETPIETFDEIVKQLCEGKLTEYECNVTLKEMNNNKRPGSDGMTVEIYKKKNNEI